MIDKEEIKIEVNKILEMLYTLYQKELKEGKISKDSLFSTFGKIIKKKSVPGKNDVPNLFSY
jgi:hypothetical protein